MFPSARTKKKELQIERRTIQPRSARIGKIRSLPEHPFSRPLRPWLRRAVRPGPRTYVETKPPRPPGTCPGSCGVWTSRGKNARTAVRFVGRRTEATLGWVARPRCGTRCSDRRATWGSDFFFGWCGDRRSVAVVAGVRGLTAAACRWRSRCVRVLAGVATAPVVGLRRRRAGGARRQRYQ
jgi:hypothetical protein